MPIPQEVKNTIATLANAKGFAAKSEDAPLVFISGANDPITKESNPMTQNTELDAIYLALKDAGFDVNPDPTKGISALDAIKEMGQRLKAAEPDDFQQIHVLTMQFGEVEDGTIPALPNEPTYDIKLRRQDSSIDGQSWAYIDFMPQAKSLERAESPSLQIELGLVNGLPTAYMYTGAGSSPQANYLQATISGVPGGGIAFMPEAGAIPVLNNIDQFSRESVAAYLSSPECLIEPGDFKEQNSRGDVITEK